MLTAGCVWSPIASSMPGMMTLPQDECILSGCVPQPTLLETGFWSDVVIWALNYQTYPVYKHAAGGPGDAFSRECFREEERRAMLRRMWNYKEIISITGCSQAVPGERGREEEGEREGGGEDKDRREKRKMRRKNQGKATWGWLEDWSPSRAIGSSTRGSSVVSH